MSSEPNRLKSCSKSELLTLKSTTVAVIQAKQNVYLQSEPKMEKEKRRSKSGRMKKPSTQ